MAEPRAAATEATKLQAFQQTLLRDMQAQALLPATGKENGSLSRWLIKNRSRLEQRKKLALAVQVSTPAPFSFTPISNVLIPAEASPALEELMVIQAQIWNAVNQSEDNSDGKAPTTSPIPASIIPGYSKLLVARKHYAQALALESRSAESLAPELIPEDTVPANEMSPTSSYRSRATETARLMKSWPILNAQQKQDLLRQMRQNTAALVDEVTRSTSAIPSSEPSK